MLPVLFKLTFDTPLMQAVLVLLALALTGYVAWSGWRGAEERRLAPWRAAAFGAFAALAALIAAVWAAPPFSPGAAKAVKAGAIALSAAVVVAAALFGRKSARKGEESSNAFWWGGGALVVAIAAMRMGLKEPLGHNFGAPLHTYGLMIATAFIVATWIASREALRSYPEQVRVDGKLVPYGPIMRDNFMDFAFWILVSSLVGAKLLFVVVNWDLYRRDPSGIFSLSGGLVFYGGFLGAVVGALLFTRSRKIDFLRLADVAIPSVAIGHMFGRFGCLAAGCCWGGIAKAGSAIAVRFPARDHLPFRGFGVDSLAWADQAKDHRWADALGHVHDHAIDGAQQISAVAQATGFTLPVYPTQLMEAAGELSLFLLLLFLRRTKRFHGQLLSIWLMGYAVLRMTIEFFRGDVARGYVFRYPAVDPILLSTSQTISLGIFLAGVALWALYGRRPAPAAAPSPA